MEKDCSLKPLRLSLEQDRLCEEYMGATGIKRLLKLPLFGLFLLWTLFPIYWMFSLALRGRGELFGALSLLPQSLTLDHFRDLFINKAFGQSIINSLTVTLISLSLALAFGLSCAYILARARFKFKIKGGMLFWVLLLRILPPIAFALPLYIMMSDAGLLSTKIPLILSHLLINIPFRILIVIFVIANNAVVRTLFVVIFVFSAFFTFNVIITVYFCFRFRIFTVIAFFVG